MVGCCTALNLVGIFLLGHQFLLSVPQRSGRSLLAVLLDLLPPSAPEGLQVREEREGVRRSCRFCHADCKGC